MQNLYQKYRPQNFEEVIGQEQIVDVLKASIANNKIQNSYLFNGPRGTGKTSMAKIFARAMNCLDTNNPLNDNCEICEYFNSQADYEDIFELDAASNNSVEDVRRIIENAYYQPVKLTKKVYIIDEVHMLSKSAFNALLKTLEEPPVHAVFILATTEPNKIPATILSRCQRFDFKRVRNDVLETHLENVLKKEEIKFEENSLHPIVELSEGCVRDSLTLLQKVVIGEEKITDKTVMDKLNLIEDNVYSQILNLLEEEKLSEVISFWEEQYQNGVNEQSFIVGFQKYLKKDLLENFNTVDNKSRIEIIKVINDIEMRAVYTSDLKSLIEIGFMNIISNKVQPNQVVEKVIVKEIPSQETNIQQKGSQEESNNQQSKTEEVSQTQNVDEQIAKMMNDVNELKGQNKKEETSNVESVSEENQIDKVNDIEDADMTNIQESITAEQEDIHVMESESLLNFTGNVNDDCLLIMEDANKEHRINFVKKFTNIAMQLNNEQKYGIAKFFGEGKIRVANQNHLVVTIEDKFVEPYNKRIDEILGLIDNVYAIKIISEKDWSIVKELYVQKMKNINNKVETNFSENDTIIIKKLEDTLNVKVKVEEE